MSADGYARQVPGRVASSDRAAVIGLGVAVSAISAAAILIREADAAALTIAFWRTAGGAVLLAPTFFASSSLLRRLSTRHIAMLGVSGLCLALHFALWLGSLELTTVASSVTLVTLSPVFVATLGTAVLGESVSRRMWLGIGVAVAGAAIIGFGDVGESSQASNPILGDLMAIGGAVAMAGYLVIGRHLRRAGVPNMVFAVPTYGIAALVLGMVVGLRGDPVFDLDGRTWVLLLVIVLGPQLLGHAMLTWVLDRLSVTTVSLATLLEPIGATALAWIALDELPATLFWVGAPTVLAGLAISTLAGRGRTGEADDPRRIT